MDLVFGLQSGINYSKTVIQTEFSNTPLRGDFFIGSSFGLIARKKLLSNSERISQSSGRIYFVSSFIFKRRSIVDTMTDFKVKIGAKETVLDG